MDPAADPPTAAELRELYARLQIRYRDEPDKWARIDRWLTDRLAEPEPAAPSLIFGLDSETRRWRLGTTAGAGLYAAGRLHRGLAVSHLALSHQVVPRADRQLVKLGGSLTPDALRETVHRAADWIGTLDGCRPVASALHRVRYPEGQVALSYNGPAVLADLPWLL